MKGCVVAAGLGHALHDGIKAEVNYAYIRRGTAMQQAPAKRGLPSPGQATQDSYALPSSSALICWTAQHAAHAATSSNSQDTNTGEAGVHMSTGICLDAVRQTHVPGQTPGRHHRQSPGPECPGLTRHHCSSLVFQATMMSSRPLRALNAPTYPATCADTDRPACYIPRCPCACQGPCRCDHLPLKGKQCGCLKAPMPLEPWRQNYKW